MTTLNDIRVALESHLAGLSTSMPDVAWPNVPYAPSPGTPFFRVEFIPVTRRPVVVGPDPEQRFSGLFYVTVFTPEDFGAAAGMAWADALMSRFNGSSSVVTSNAVVRLEYSETKMPLHDPPFYAIPVEIGWYAFAP
jgi:hypothetical protein